VEYLFKDTNFKVVKDNLEPLVLSLLDAKPMHGYAIIKAMKYKHGISLGTSTIYPELIRLQQKLIVTSQWSHDADKPRKIYTLTDKGKVLLAEYTQGIKFVMVPFLNVLTVSGSTR
jgi:PadR family transcriptional regulator PadR